MALSGGVLNGSVGSGRDGREQRGRKKKVLIVAPHFVPGFKAGGPVRSVVKIVESLGDEFEFFVVTTDRDLGDLGPYRTVRVGEWQKVSGAHVRYLAPGERGFRRLWGILGEVEYDLLYLNSFFLPWAAITPLVLARVGLLRVKPVLLAPRGEFSPGAIGLKRVKKRSYVWVARVAGLVRRLNWHASSPYEAKDIECAVGADKQCVYVAPNLSEAPAMRIEPSGRDGEPDFHVGFLSRISPKKNLHYALEVIRDVEAPVTFNVYGPVEDEEYWRVCEARISELPSHVAVQYHGPVNPAEVPDLLRANDLFFLPTLGENYGHVIAEALAVGTPVLISDQTPWRGLEERGLGFDLPLSDRSKFAEVIEKSARFDPAGRLERRHATHAAMLRYRDESDDVASNREMFRQVIEAGNG